MLTLMTNKPLNYSHKKTRNLNIDIKLVNDARSCIKTREIGDLNIFGLFYIHHLVFPKMRVAEWA